MLLLLSGGSGVIEAQTVAAPADSAAMRLHPRSRDRWLGKDKINHATASAFLVGAQFYAWHGEKGEAHASSLRAALAGTLVLGVAKEIYDGVSKRGTPSFKDLAADALGMAVAALLLRP